MPIFLHQSCEESPKHLHQTNFEKYAQQTMFSNCIFGCGKSGPKCARSFGPSQSCHPGLRQVFATQGQKAWVFKIFLKNILVGQGQGI
jgi:hypothetical protein